MFYYLYSLEMNNLSLVQVLEKQWLSESESLTYLEVLRLWLIPASTVARYTWMNRVSVYTILWVLEKKGFISCILKNKTKYFSALDPVVFLKPLEEKYQILKEYLPMLQWLANTYTQKPQIEYFEGVSGLIQMFERQLQSNNKEIKAFIWRQEMHPEIKKYLSSVFIPKRVGLWISAKIITVPHDENNIYEPKNAKESKKLLKETRVYNTSAIELPIEIMIVWNQLHIWLYTIDEMYGIIITSEKLSRTITSFFDVFRQISDKV